jgi:ketosteroid isomerase-like protein
MSDWSHAGELHLDEVELIDLGDRLVLLAALSLRWHRQADPPLSRSWASVTTRERGRTIREHYYWSHAEALAAVGLSEQATSHENVDLVKQHYAALSRADYAAAMDMYAEDFEQDLTRVDGEINRGKDAVSRAWVRWVAPWDEFCMQAEAVIDAGEEVLALVRQSGIGKQSGVPVKLDFGAVWTVSDGRLLKLVVYPRRSDAFAAVGLSERT